jgi:tetratricopeptide (TPR) repeat protein
MLRQRRPDMDRFEIDWFQLVSAAVIVLYCLCVPCALAQVSGAKANAQRTLPDGSDPILVAQIPLADGGLTEAGIQPKAMQIYRQAVRELHSGQARTAESDAQRAVKLDAKFADADALAATAALVQRQFNRANAEACEAVRIDANDEKAWVILATAENYLDRYGEAADALGHVRVQDQATWQVAYQWARVEAGEEHAVQALEWANRAALTAPPEFAPLHLLRASALLAAGQYARAADELETYLQLPGVHAPEHPELMEELRRLRKLSRGRAFISEEANYNALAN